MRRIKNRMCHAGALVVSIMAACAVAGCGDFSQRYLGDVRKEAPHEAPPKPSSALYIPNPPASANDAHDPAVQPAAYQALRETPGVVPQANDNNLPVLSHSMSVLYKRAAQTYAGMDSYIYRLRRREAVGGAKRPEEVMQVKLRQKPFSVYLKWLSDEGKGREVVYVRGKYDDKMQMVLAANDAFPFSPAGMRFSLSPNDRLARGKSRYPITETGFGSLIERFGKMVAAIERGDARGGTAKYLGRVKRREFALPVEAVRQLLPSGSDAQMPKGGERFWYFDATNGLPVLLIANEGEGNAAVEVEYYCHDNIQFPVNLDDIDFNPDWLRRK